MERLRLLFWRIGRGLFSFYQMDSVVFDESFFHNKRLHNAFEIVVQSRFEKTSLDAL